MNQITGRDGATKGKRPLIIISGPTAVGKSALAVALAKEIGGEVISADSMQVYRYMDIGSAKITKEEMQGIPHYCIDILDPSEEYNVHSFQKMAREAVERIYANGHIPIVAGGTGFYIQALLYDIDFTKTEKNTKYRSELTAIGRQENGTDLLFAMLKECDPEAALAIHPNNTKRVIRALEYFHETGQKISEHNEREKEKPSAFHSFYFVITDDRSAMYDRIDRRVDKMLADGLVEEVRKLKNMGLDKSNVSMQGIGYKEMLDYLDGLISLEDAASQIKQGTRHFAKRQLTWFRRERDVIWIDRSKFSSQEKILAEMRSYF